MICTLQLRPAMTGDFVGVDCDKGTDNIDDSAVQASPVVNHFHAPRFFLGGGKMIVFITSC